MSEINKSSIKCWAEDDRPREKLQIKGTSALSDAELIAILIGSGTASESAVQLSQRILQHIQGNLIELSKLSLADLMKFKGIGQVKALSIVAALELGKRRRSSEIQEKFQITRSNHAFEILQEHLAYSNFEHFAAILLNRANRVIRTVSISTGGITGTVVDPKKVFKFALEFNATSMILGHNHPSGQIQPSEADIALTRKLKNAGDLMDIPILDHIIVGDERYYSFADDGRL
ncbi:MAG: DNA repair protein RadC [Bacteroidales bacterium]|nr:DNA repair protein RadC [Bacteroidales bacterium]